MHADTKTVLISLKMHAGNEIPLQNAWNAIPLEPVELGYLYISNSFQARLETSNQRTFVQKVHQIFVKNTPITSR
ncbi:hypothetical protein HanIR_Chr17g0885901 [Helianthus annuus]|nr:hypothetical protein HanIR_Chr17g0885901 [Helianthus annuus]